MFKFIISMLILATVFFLAIGFLTTATIIHHAVTTTTSMETDR